MKNLQPARWPIFSSMVTLLPPPRDQRDLQSTLNAFLKFFSSLRRSFEDFGCFWASSLFAYSSSVGPEYSIKFAFQANEDARSVPCSTALRANLLLYSYLDRKWSRQNQGINSDIIPQGVAFICCVYDMFCCCLGGFGQSVGKQLQNGAISIRQPNPSPLRLVYTLSKQ